MTTILFIIIAAACFLAAVLNLAVENRLRNRIMSVLDTIAVVLGLILYGYGYSYVFGFNLIAVLHTIMSVCKMVGGSSDLNSIASAPLFENQWILILFWAAHFMAFYAVAGTAAAALGGKLLQRIRVAFLRRGTLLLIYGVNEDSVSYGKRQMDVLHRSVVFIGQGDSALEAEIHAAGGVLERNGERRMAGCCASWACAPASDPSKLPPFMKTKRRILFLSAICKKHLKRPLSCPGKPAC